MDLVGFEFNENARMKGFASFKPIVTAKGGVMKVAFNELSVPQHFSFPLKSFRCVVTVSLSVFSLTEDLMLSHAKNESFELNKHTKVVPAQTFNFDVPPGCLSLIRMALEFFVVAKSGWKAVTDAKANPSVICGALYTSGVFKKGTFANWTSQKNFKMA